MTQILRHGLFDPSVRVARFRAIAIGAVLTAGLFLPLGASAAGLADAPASAIGSVVATTAETATPNLGLAAAAPQAVNGTMDDFTLRSLGLTPPGNTPTPCLSCTSIVWGD